MAVEIVFAYGLGQFGQLFFDNFVKKTKLVPNLIKIDVEGAEGRVISGMSKILKECRPLVLFEYHPEGIKSFPDTFEEIFKKFKEVDYSLFRHSQPIGHPSIGGYRCRPKLSEDARRRYVARIRGDSS